MAFEQFALVISLFQQLCVYLVIAWLLSKTPLFMPLTQVTLSWPHKILCYLIFSGFCVMGTYFGLRIEDSIANTCAIGAVLGGIVGGPVVGLLVGLTGGIHRYSLGLYRPGLHLLHHRRRAARRPGAPPLRRPPPARSAVQPLGGGICGSSSPS